MKVIHKQITLLYHERVVPVVWTQQSPKYISNDSKTQQDVGGFSVGILCWWLAKELTSIEPHIAQWTFTRKVVWTKGCTTLYTELPMSPRQMKRLWRSKDRRVKCFLFVLILFAFFCWLVLNWNGYLYLYFLFYYFFLIFNFYLIFCYFFFNFPLGDTTRVRGGCVGTERWVWFHDMKFPRNEF